MTTETLTLSQFLLERIADTERVALAAAEAAGSMPSVSWFVDGPAANSGKYWVYATGEKFEREATAEHIARNDPARVLATCKAHRAIVERTEARRRTQWSSYVDEHRKSFAEWDAEWPDDPVLRALASIYADDPAFDPGWAP